MNGTKSFRKNRPFASRKARRLKKHATCSQNPAVTPRMLKVMRVVAFVLPPGGQGGFFHVSMI